MLAEGEGHVPSKQGPRVYVCTVGLEDTLTNVEPSRALSPRTRMG
jgi:hypothetical protein